ncbi:MAG: ribosomal protein S18-alanine N-acetyltransferase [Oscillospiraceae bacterium]|nr:ribosomal protein S18-alanine N-acetyltransferase [Oscillospiraceae bacterium]
MIEIIQMQSVHAPQVAALEKQCFSEPWSENSIAGELSNPLSLWLVALDGDCVAGYVGSQSVMGETDMMNIAVSPKYRRQGVAEALIEELVRQLQEKGNHCLTLEVRVSNDAAVKLYEKLGFTQIGRRPNYYRSPKEDALILRKEWQL